MITVEQLTRFAGINDLAMVEGINQTLERFEINTSRRIRYFMTHAAFETLGFAKFVENMNYRTADRLVAVWPRRFSMEHEPNKAYAPDYVAKPEKLANFVYGGRNGNVEPNDGWDFRGRGGFHLTFRDNYAAYSQDVYGDDRVVQEPDMVALPADAMMSAGWFWDSRRLNQLADSDSFTKVTTIVNGSAATVPNRLITLNKANTVF